jgi:Uma2 family endonuclease
MEVLSPSNTPAKVNRQRIVAMSAGTAEFWVVEPENRTVIVTDLRSAKVYASGDAIPLTIPGGGTIAVDDIFAL